MAREMRRPHGGTSIFGRTSRTVMTYSNFHAKTRHQGRRVCL